MPLISLRNVEWFSEVGRISSTAPDMRRVSPITWIRDGILRSVSDELGEQCLPLLGERQHSKESRSQEGAALVRFGAPVALPSPGKQHLLCMNRPDG